MRVRIVVVVATLLQIQVVCAGSALAEDTVFLRGTVWRLPRTLITEADPTALRGVTYLGKLERLMRPYQEGGGRQRMVEPVYVFEAEYDRNTIEFQVYPDVGDRAAARAEVDRHTPIFGRLPWALREYVREVELSELGGGNASPWHWWPNLDEAGVIMIGAERDRTTVRNGFMEEVYMHEGVHVSLEHERGTAPGWFEAAAADEKFISPYARDNWDSEDMAETFAAWFAVRYRPETLSADDHQAIIDGVPNRLAWFDQQGYDMVPFRRAVPVSALPLVGVLLLAGLLYAAGRAGKSSLSRA